MKKFVMILFLGVVPNVHADIFGGDLAILGQILQNAMSQLTQLEQLFDKASEQHAYIQKLNEGLNHTLDILETASDISNHKTFSDVNDVVSLYEKLEHLYGKIPKSHQSEMQKLMDQSVAESLKMNNDIIDYSNRLDREGERIKNHAKIASPGGAAKLTAQSNGAILQALAQVERNQGRQIVLQSEVLALNNSHEKSHSFVFQKQYEEILQGFDHLKDELSLPRIQ